MFSPKRVIPNSAVAAAISCSQRGATLTSQELDMPEANRCADALAAAQQAHR